MAGKAGLIIFAAVFLLLSAGYVSAAGMFDVNILQADAALPEIKVFLDILDQDGNPVSDMALQKENVSAVIGGKPARVDEIKSLQDSGEGTAYILLADISQSIDSNSFSNVRDALLKRIDALGPRDFVSLISFGEEVKVLRTYSNDKAILKETVKNLKAVDENTRFYDALGKAMDMVNITAPGLPDRKVILVISDGRDDFAGGSTKDELLRKCRETKIPVYAVGVSGTAVSAQAQSYLDILGEFARSSNGAYYQMSSESMDEIASDISGRLGSCYVIKLFFDGYKADGAVYHMDISLTDGGNTVSDGTDIRLAGGISDAQSQNQATVPVMTNEAQKNSAAAGSTAIKSFFTKNRLIIILSAVIAVLLIALLLIKKRIRRWLTVLFPRERELPAVDVNNQTKGIGLRLTEVDPNGKQMNYELNLSYKIVIGRAKDCGLTLDDNQISNIHCELILKDGKIFVRDLDSRNGTYVNGIKVPAGSRQPVDDNDTISLGRRCLRMRIVS